MIGVILLLLAFGAAAWFLVEPLAVNAWPEHQLLAVYTARVVAILITVGALVAVLLRDLT